MRKQLLLPGNGILIYQVHTGQTAARAGNNTSLSFACQSGEAAFTNRLNNRFSDTGITGETLAINAPIPGRPGKTLPARTVSPAGPQPAGKITARQPVSARRKALLRWSMRGSVPGLTTDIFPVCRQPNRILTHLLPAAAWLNNLINTDHSIITLMHQRKWTQRRRPAYC